MVGTWGRGRGGGRGEGEEEERGTRMRRDG